MRDAFFHTLLELAEQDDRIVFLTGDLGFKLVDPFANRFPTRFYNMGVAEANMISVAAGLALSGKVVFVYSIVPFVTARCVEQIRNDLCNMQAHVIVVGVGGGYAYGENGPTHHGIDDVGLMRSLPEMTVVCPCDPAEAADAMRKLVHQRKPAYLRLGRAGEKALPRAGDHFELQRPTLIRSGTDVAIVATGAIACEALAAAKDLAASAIDAAVFSLHTVKPIEPAIEYFAESNYRLVVLVEEHAPCGGMTEAVSSRLGMANRNTRIECICAPDGFQHDVANASELRARAGIDSEAIKARVLSATEHAPC